MRTVDAGPSITCGIRQSGFPRISPRRRPVVALVVVSRNVHVSLAVIVKLPPKSWPSINPSNGVPGKVFRSFDLGGWIDTLAGGKRTAAPGVANGSPTRRQRSVSVVQSSAGLAGDLSQLC